VERLLEREDELATLGAAHEEALAGRGSLVLIGGEAGSGKSSLIRGLRERTDDRALFVLVGCEPLSVPVPLAPVHALVNAIEAADLLEHHAGDHVALASALHDAMQARCPAVVVVEDAHWADPATLDVIRLLVRRIGDARMVVVITYRDDEAAANASLITLVGDLATRERVRRIAMRPLSESAIRELAEPVGLDARELAAVTNGNAFLVVEAIAAGGAMPSSVREATLARVGRLGAEARGVVEVAAVIGQRVSPQLLQQVVPDSLTATEEAIARGVLISDGENLGFRHELTRQAIEESISASRLVELHRRVLAALTEVGRIDPARLADHAEHAGLAADARRYAELAAAEAERVGALREASLQLARALRSDDGLDGASRFELLLRYVRATNFAGGLEDARLAGEEAFELAKRELDSAAQGRALTLLGWALWSLDRVAEAKRAAESAVTLLRATDDVDALARAWSSDLRMEAVAFDAEAVVASAPGALELAKRAGLEDVRIDIAISVGLARGHLGEAPAQQQLADELSRAREARLPFQAIRAYVNAIDVAADFRDHDTVDALTEEALDRLDAYQTAIPRENVLISVGRSLLDRGRYDEAIRHATLGRRNSHGGVPLSLAIEGLVLARRGQGGAEELVHRAWEEIADLPKGWRHAHLRAALAEVAWLKGDLEAALGHVRAGLAVEHAGQLARPAGDLALWALRCGMRVEPPTAAAAHVHSELSGDWRDAQLEWRRLEAPYEHALAALPGTDRDARDAMAALQRLGAIAAARAFARERKRRGERTTRGPRPSTASNAAGLTRREQEVLEHLAGGSTNPGIAQSLHLSERTVAHHVSSILAKLDAPTRTAAVEAARRAGVLPQDGTVSGPT
jgi:DNA-binding CsgD family transcriptional regulator/tetratricopeptide (TPR) repeat protein